MRSISIISTLLPVLLFAQSNLDPPEVIDVEFMGNRSISSSELINQISINEKSLFNEGSLFNIFHLRRETENLRKYFEQYGYLDVVVRDSVIQYNDKEVGIRFLINEGSRYYLKSAEVLGNQVISDEEYFRDLDIAEGTPFNVFEIRKQLRRVLRIYEETGYPLVMISDSAAVTDSVALFINVREGPRLRIGSIAVPDMKEIPRRYIQRELIVESDQWFNIALIEESKRRLFETGLFSNVNIATSSIDTVNHLIDLRVEVLAAKFRAFDIDFGAEQTREFINADPVVSIGSSGSWYHNNIFNSTRRVKVQTQLNSIYPDIFIPQLFNLDFYYVEPWIFSLRVPLTINPFLRYYNEASSEYLSQAGGIRLGTSYRWFRRVRLLSFLEWSTVKIEGEADIDREGFQEQRVFETRFILDERNSYFTPSKGYRVNINPRIVGYALGGETKYWQIESSISTYWSLFSKMVLAQNLNVALSGVPDSTYVIPSPQRFYLGGNSSVRGYAFQGVGPVGGQDGLTPIGGNFRVFANLELRFPIYRFLGGELFYDVGGLWPDTEIATFSNMKSAVGLGLTVDTPIGPARVDYGIPVIDGQLAKRGEIHIAIAHAF